MGERFSSIQVAVGLQVVHACSRFRHLNGRVAAMQAAGLPVVSVDCKKEELVGNFANGGREWRPKGSPTQVPGHDFALPGEGKAAPYGVYDVAANDGWVSQGSLDRRKLTGVKPRTPNENDKD